MSETPPPTPVKKGRCARCLQPIALEAMRELEFNARQANWTNVKVCRWCLVKLVAECVQWLSQ